MRIVCVWKEESDHAREVRDWMRDFARQTGREVESVDPESREGEGFVRAHDVTMYPTVMVVGMDGRVAEQWRGTPLPMIDAVVGMLN